MRVRSRADRVREELEREERLAFGPGYAVIGPETGAPLQFTDGGDPGRKFLLDGSVPWHTPEHGWGSGFVVSDGGAARWSAPGSVTWESGIVQACYQPAPGLELAVTREGGDVLRETYALRNVSSGEIRVTGLGVQTPFGDLYHSAAVALAEAVHAHVFPGGTWAWALARPMDGIGRSLGLIVRRGQICGYSIESRNSNQLSNARGHIVLEVTGAARNPGAFGGQPVLTLPPGGEYVLEWELGWYDEVAQFLDATRPPASFARYAAPAGGQIAVRAARPVHPHSAEVRAEDRDGETILTADSPGTYVIGIGDDAQTEVLFHLPLEQAVRARAGYILGHQVTRYRPGVRAWALAPADTTTGLTQLSGGWADWSDGSERTSMAVMLQLALNRGWLGEGQVGELLAGWSRFARECLLDSAGLPTRDSEVRTAPRLYDSPWLARFFLERYRFTRDRADLGLSERILSAAIGHGLGRFLGIGFSEACTEVATELDAIGQGRGAAALRAAVVSSARHFAAAGRDLPPHEVSYEQSIVAPLLNLLIDAHRLDGGDEFLAAIRERLPWLLAFGGPQPHVRLSGIGIRHWDGYWFGQRRLWGDVFPHYWSTLSATVLARLPEPLATPQTRELAEAILRAGMVNFFPDGTATCAFVLPSAVDGQPAHVADPLANDQDWHLALWLILANSEGIGVE